MTSLGAVSSLSKLFLFLRESDVIILKVMTSLSRKNDLHMKTASFHPGYYYHVFNRTNNQELLFKSVDNYAYFLKRYTFFLAPFVRTYAFCLLPNHFHLLISIRETEEIITYLQQLPRAERTQTQHSFLENQQEAKIGELVSQQFRRFFIGYTEAINKAYHRNGSLFARPFKRKWIEQESYLANVIVYIHSNPVNHSVSDNFKTYRWSSYRIFFSEQPTQLERAAVLEWFEGKENFIRVHEGGSNARDDITLA